MIVSGVTLPVSSAAVAVTTLKVEPGGYSSCVVRLSSGWFGSPLSWREARRDLVRVVGRVGRHHAHLAGLRLDRDDRALAPAERRVGGLLRPRTSRFVTTSVALALRLSQPGEDRLELVLLAGERVVARLLEADGGRCVMNE